MSLNNFFKQKQQLQKEKEEKINSKQRVIRLKRNIQSVQLKARASQRIETFQETMMSKQYVESMKNGSYPLLPTSKHSFRDREKDKEMEKMGGIYLKTFQVAKTELKPHNKNLGLLIQQQVSLIQTFQLKIMKSG